MKVFAESQTRLLHLICLVGFALVLVNSIKVMPIIADLFIGGDGDDQMRLVEVRDWLGGQGWFDMRQYRVLPPEGISMHWSRYLDAAIGAVLTVAKLFLPGPQAEYATLILWPSFLACLMVLILAHGNYRLFGAAGAIGALAVFFGWSKLGGEYVAPRIDHHNIQMMGAAAVFYLSLVPGRARLLGVLAGLAMACALAIGLEMLPVFATIWGVVALRYAFGEKDLGGWLIGFGIAFSLAAPLLMAGQTPFAAWGTRYCDVLAIPVMTLGAVGVVSTLVPVIFERHLTSPATRIAALVIVAGLGLWLCFPVLGHCLAGPYSDVPPEIRKTITSKISEALPASRMLVLFPEILGRLLLPPLITLILALVAIWFMRSRLSRQQWTVLIQALVVSAVGLGFALIQVRATNLMTPAIPLLGGFVVYAFSQIPRADRIRLPLALLLLLAMPSTVERIVTYYLEPRMETMAASGTGAPVKMRKACRSRGAMDEVARLPKSLIFNPVNLGMTILLTTNHSVTSAAYHRSADAFWNGVGAFQSEDALRAALKKSGADIVIICEGGLGDGEAILRDSLKVKQLPAWLTLEPGDRSYLAVFKVDKAALAADSAP